ncbi:hypothetical protein WJX81_006110 [Elliptochloris bilobata]|uniref:THO1-MOS11 C-terminal domain-containing protein n=1 Tax=Elliptochloris bilobata TaxID=381761 RepID=A0AAW1RCY3_9CHLO
MDALRALSPRSRASSLQALTRTALQRLAKEAGLRANAKSADIAAGQRAALATVAGVPSAVESPGGAVVQHVDAGGPAARDSPLLARAFERGRRSGLFLGHASARMGALEEQWAVYKERVGAPDPVAAAATAAALAGAGFTTVASPALRPAQRAALARRIGAGKRGREDPPPGGEGHASGTLAGPRGAATPGKPARLPLAQFNAATPGKQPVGASRAEKAQAAFAARRAAAKQRGKA